MDGDDMNRGRLRAPPFLSAVGMGAAVGCGPGVIVLWIASNGVPPALDWGLSWPIYVAAFGSWYGASLGAIGGAMYWGAIHVVGRWVPGPEPGAELSKGERTERWALSRVEWAIVRAVFLLLALVWATVGWVAGAGPTQSPLRALIGMAVGVGMASAAYKLMRRHVGTRA